jgi:hypothetical protein
MPPVAFEPTISAGERLQTLDRAATGISFLSLYPLMNNVLCSYADILLDLPLITYFIPFQQSSIPSNRKTFVIGSTISNPEQVDYEI